MKISVLKINPTCGLLAFTLLTTGLVRAQNEAPPGNFFTPAYRGQANAESAFWNDTSSSPNGAFTNSYGGPNQAAYVAPGGNLLANASVTQTTPGALPPLGNGDIYSFSSINTFVLNYSGSSLTPIGNVVFQTETTGTELDYSSVLLTYTGDDGTQTLSATRNELYNDTEETSFGPSSDVLSEWSWNLPTDDDVTGFSIAFNGSGPSLGLERVMLDVSPTPEPGSAALAGIGGLGLWRGIGRFRRRAIR